MKTLIQQFTPSSRITVFTIAAVLCSICAVSNAGAQDGKLSKTQRDMLQNNMPQVRVLDIPASTPHKVEAPMIKAAIPANSPEPVRVTRNGKLVDTPVTFRAKVTAVSDDGIIMFGDGHSVALRLPKGHDYALSGSDNLSVTYKPTTTAGTDENSLELRRPNGPDTNKRGGVLMAAIVQRGGAKPLVVDTHEFTVTQGTQEKVVLTTDSETTTAPDTYITLKESGQKIALTKGKAVTFKAMGRAFNISLINSLHVTHNTKDSLSDEGAHYWLEYVVTETNTK